MDRELIEKWASNLVNHSLKRQFKNRGEGSIYGKKILVRGEVVSEQLMVALEEEITKKGGFPYIRPFFSNHHRTNPFSGIPALEFGNEAQVDHVPNYAYEMFKEMDGFITLLGTTKPLAFEDRLNGFNALRNATSDLDRLRTEESAWVLTKFPTREDAKFEGINFVNYRNFVLNSAAVDYALLEERQKELAQFLEESKDIVVKSFNPLENRVCELNMSKGDNLAVSCIGLRNFPDGEVYTSPHAKTLDGEVFLDVPIYQGTTIGGVYLKFKEGVIVDYSAEQGYEMLKEIIETDNDSKKIGEFAFGTNEGITQTLKEILYTEKMGGTIHLAIGKSYEKTYPSLVNLLGKEKEVEKKRLNELGLYSDSKQHIDIPCDFRNPKKGEGIYLDGREVVWNGTCWNF